MSDLPTMDPSRASPPLMAYFITSSAIGAAGNLLLLIVVGLSRRVTRHPTWYGFCLSWVLYCIALLFMTITGQQFAPRPRRGICFTQAILIYALTVLACAGVLSFVLHLWLHLRSMLRHESHKESWWRNLILLTLPYFLSFLVLMVVLVQGADHPDAIRWNTTGMFCIIDTRIPELVVSTMCIIIIVVIVVLEVSIAVSLFHHWVHLSGLKSLTSAFIAIMIRVAIFTAFGILGIIVCAAVLLARHTLLPGIYMTLLPVIAFVLLGTQVDIIRIYRFWGNTELPDGDNDDDTEGVGSKNV